MTLLLALLLAAPCSSVTSSVVVTPVKIATLPQAGGKYLAQVSVSGTLFIQNLYTLPISGTWAIDASYDGGATWCEEVTSTSFVMATAVATVSTSVPMLIYATQRRVTASPGGAVDPNACGLNQTWNYTISPTSTGP